MKKSKNILICPLNWGLGHASRMIPIIDYCISAKKNIIIAGNGNSLSLLANRFPSIITEHIPAPTLNYNKRRAIGINLYFNFFMLIINLFKEKRYVKKIVHKYNIDTIISDNRPGIYLPKLKSIYITHQINVYNSEKKGIISTMLTKLHRKIIKRYDYCFVPDFGNNSIAGRLSENTTGLNLVYIGPLSRFSILTPNYLENIPKYGIVCIVSGPEPQRMIFEELLIFKFKEGNENAIILQGLPAQENNSRQIGNVSLINHCSDSEFYSYLNSAKIIICRSGYSSIMDLITLGKTAVLIPTPGQPEQEYLGKHLANFGFTCVKQKDFKNFDISSITVNELDSNNQNSIDLKKILDLYL